MEESFSIDDPIRVKNQYQSKDPLNVRIQTHLLYTHPQIDFVSWVLDQVSWSGTETVLDLGCGPGNYVVAVQNRARQYLAGDLSIGMLTNLGPDIPRLQLDAEQLPLRSAAFDVLLANHMLYHLPHLDLGLGQIRRVLRPGGWLVAATNSQEHMLELKSLILKVWRYLSRSNKTRENQDNLVAGFNLENGQTILELYFDQVERFVLDSSLIFPSSAPVIHYVESMREFYEASMPSDITWDNFLTELTLKIDLAVKRHGHFRASKKAGVFICYR